MPVSSSWTSPSPIWGCLRQEKPKRSEGSLVLGATWHQPFLTEGSVACEVKGARDGPLLSEDKMPQQTSHSSQTDLV